MKRAREQRASSDQRARSVLRLRIAVEQALTRIQGDRVVNGKTPEPGLPMNGGELEVAMAKGGMPN